MVSETNALNFYSIPEISLLDLVVFSVAGVVLQTSPAPRGWMNLQTSGATVRQIGVLCKANFCSFRDVSYHLRLVVSTIARNRGTRSIHVFFAGKSFFWMLYVLQNKEKQIESRSSGVKVNERVYL